jgi:hypothetical protein
MILILAERADPQEIEGSDESFLSLLLRTDEVRRYSTAAADRLIQKFFLSCDSAIANVAPELLNSYILVAIMLDLPHLLQHFHDHGFQIDRNAKAKRVLMDPGMVVIKSDVVEDYTWLSCAVHFGRPECVKVFLQNGADFARDSLSADQFALSMAKGHGAGPHPRATTQIYIWPYQPPRRVVPAEDDNAVLEAFRFAGGDLDTNSSLMHLTRDTGDRGLPALNGRATTTIRGEPLIGELTHPDTDSTHRSMRSRVVVSCAGGRETPARPP